MNVNRSIEVAVVICPALRADPRPLILAKIMFYKSTIRTCLARWKPSVNLHNLFVMSLTNGIKLVKKISKAKVRDLFTMFLAHVFHIKIFKSKARRTGRQDDWQVSIAKSSRRFATRRCTLASVFLAFLRLLEPLTLREMLREAFAISFRLCLKNKGDLISEPSETVRKVVQPKSKPADFTCLWFLFSWHSSSSYNCNKPISNLISLNSQSLWFTKEFARVRELICVATNFQFVATKILPTGILQGERLVLASRTKRWGSFVITLEKGLGTLFQCVL